MCEVGRLLDGDFDGGLNLFLLKGDGEDAVFEFGLDRVFVFLDLDRKRDGAREFAPVALLDVPSGGVFIFPAAVRILSEIVTLRSDLEMPAVRALTTSLSAVS